MAGFAGRPLGSTNAKKSPSGMFAPGLSFYKLVWIFLIASVVGYVVEMIFCYSQLGYFESRKGLVYGPFSPVYGFGAVLFTMLMYQLRRAGNWTVFGVCAVAGALFEYVCSFFQEMAFGTVSWEYSRSSFHLAGRTNLKYAIFWGILGLFFIRCILPWVSKMIEKMPICFARPATYVVIALLFANILISCMAVKAWTDRQKQLPVIGAYAQFMKRHYPDDRMKEIYPNMHLVPEGEEESKSQQ